MPQKKQREKWLVKNISSKSISLGIISMPTIDVSDQLLKVGDRGEINMVGSETDGMLTFSAATLTSTTTMLERDTLEINSKYVDLCSAQIIKLRAFNISTSPINPVTGEIYFDTSTKKLRCWDGDSWQNAW